MEDDSWQTNQKVLEQETDKYFKKLFSNEGFIPQSQQDLVPHLVILEEKSNDLLAPVTNKEVRRAMKCLHL